MGLMGSELSFVSEVAHRQSQAPPRGERHEVTDQRVRIEEH